MTELFWSSGEERQMSEEELQVFHSFGQVSARVICLIRAWACRALGDLPVQARDWVLKGESLSRESPDWVDFSNPDLVLGDLLSLSNRLPTCQPEWIRLLPAQQSAFNVLCGIRSMIDDLAAVGVTLSSLRLIEKSLILGIESAKGHVKPYERYASFALKNTKNLKNQNLGSPEGSANAERRKKGDSDAKVWQQEFDRLRLEFGRTNRKLSKRRAGQLIAKNPLMPPGDPDWIRQKLK